MANPTLEMIHGMLYGKGLHFGQPSRLGTHYRGDDGRCDGCGAIHGTADP